MKNNKLNKYNKNRDFKVTSEPKGKVGKPQKNRRLFFCVQHHMASKEHYDLRLEWEGVLVSWAVPKGPSLNPKDKRLAILVEDHPLDYLDFEGVIPKGQYGGGTVMLWDVGEWEPLTDIKGEIKNQAIKFSLTGKKLKGNWMLTPFKTSDKQNTWLLIKESDTHASTAINITDKNLSIKTSRTMQEIADNKKIKISNAELKKELKSFLSIDEKTKEHKVSNVQLSSPNRIIFPKAKLTKLDLALYYAYISNHMMPYIENRIVSAVRCPKGADEECFYKKHPEKNSKFIKKITLPTKDKSKNTEYFYINDIDGLVSEVQLGTIEFHTWGSMATSINKPDIMVFDLDPDENLGLKEIRLGVRHLKQVLDDLGLVSFLKTSGKKGYHVVVPFEKGVSWKVFKEFSKNVALVMEQMWEDRYTSNSRKSARKGRTYIDWVRNTKSATSVAPYSVRINEKGSVSMPIDWSELGRIRPDSVTMLDACKRVLLSNPWQDFFTVKQQLTNKS